jgi:hypothetical protein
MAEYQKQVDEFILSMNRAAEAAAPLASRYFGDAIRAMSVDDVRGILTGGDTAATEFFRAKTHDKLYTAFRPVVSQKVSQVGATSAYKSMMGRYESVPMVHSQSLDLDDYVTNKSLDGLFHMVGEECSRRYLARSSPRRPRAAVPAAASRRCTCPAWKSYRHPRPTRSSIGTV